MEKSLRGNKHVCSNCNTKFYDFNKEKIMCPNCGTEVLIKKENLNLPNNSKVKNEKIDKELELEEEVEFDDDIEEVISDEDESEKE